MKCCLLLVWILCLLAACIGEPTATPTPSDSPPLPPAAPSAGDTWTRPKDDAVMVYVPAGEFLMGSTDEDIGAVLDECSDCERSWFSDEQPQHTVYLDAFWIDRTEVTNAQYRKCVEAEACKESGCWDESDVNAPDQPVVCVVWDDAQDYAAWVGGRLPTEAEWEKAARGTDGRLYPWGNSPPDCHKANYVGCAGKALPVGSHPEGASPYGVLDMAGNVFEWVADLYDADYYSWTPFRNPQGPPPSSCSFRVLRGGSFGNYLGLVYCASREGNYPINRRDLDGFRVVVAPVPPEPD